VESQIIKIAQTNSGGRGAFTAKPGPNGTWPRADYRAAPIADCITRRIRLDPKSTPGHFKPGPRVTRPRATTDPRPSPTTARDPALLIPKDGRRPLQTGPSSTKAGGGPRPRPSPNYRQGGPSTSIPACLRLPEKRGAACVTEQGRRADRAMGPDYQTRRSRARSIPRTPAVAHLNRGPRVPKPRATIDPAPIADSRRRRSASIPSYG